MATNTVYYVGTGKKLNRKTAKKYKTLAGASAAALKIGGSVWDSAGVIVAQPEQEPASAPAEEVAAAVAEPAPEAAETAVDEAEAATEDAETEEAEEQPEAEETAVNEAEDAQDAPEKQKRKIATVIVGGSLRLRRSAAWDNGNVCGYASAGQSYHVKRVFEVDGRPMLETIEGLFISAAPEHVKITSKA